VDRQHGYGISVAPFFGSEVRRNTEDDLHARTSLPSVGRFATPPGSTVAWRVDRSPAYSMSWLRQYRSPPFLTRNSAGARHAWAALHIAIGLPLNRLLIPRAPRPALEPVERGETLLGGPQGTEPLVAKPAPENPASGIQAMHRAIPRRKRCRACMRRPRAIFRASSRSTEQMLVLGLLFQVTGVPTNLVVAFGGSMARWIARCPTCARIENWCASILPIGLCCRLAFERC
jgi:hypothetical protein